MPDDEVADSDAVVFEEEVEEEPEADQVEEEIKEGGEEKEDPNLIASPGHPYVFTGSKDCPLHDPTNVHPIEGDGLSCLQATIDLGGNSVDALSYSGQGHPSNHNGCGVFPLKWNKS